MPTENRALKIYEKGAYTSCDVLPADRFAFMSTRIFGSRAARVFLLSLILFVQVIAAGAATWYVDPNASGPIHDGTSWTYAWTSLSLSGVSAGDTVYISGGLSGQTQTYNLSSGFDAIPGFAYGTGGVAVTYQIGQDSAHNGTAIFNGTSGGCFLVHGYQYVKIVGDAGDGKMHFQTSGYVQIQNDAPQGCRIGYVNFGQMNWGSGNANIINAGNAGPGYEFDHNYCYLSSPQANAFAFFNFKTSTTWDQNLIHDNTIYLPRASGSSSGSGADGIETGLSIGYSIYNNVIVAYPISGGYTGGQHQDGVQDTGGSSYIKIYGNVFVNLGNSAIFGDAAFAGFNNFYIYNNIFIITDSTMGLNKGGVEVGVDGGYSGLGGPQPVPMTNVIIANNIADGYSSSDQPFTLNNSPNLPANFTGGLVANNILLNCHGASISTRNDSAAVVESNATLTAANGASYFVSYSPTGGLANDYHVTSSATTLIGQGVNLTSYFNTDRDGKLRASTGVWDIGPYVSVYTASTLFAPTGLRVVVP